VRLRILLLALIVSLFAGVPAAGAKRPARPGHVFVIVLENENASETFGPDSPATYLSKTLPSKGQFVPNYYAVTHLSLGNYVAMLSGQGSNIQTQADCQYFTEFLPALPAIDGQFIGQGCVYPATVDTLANQLTRAGRTWKGYMEDMGTPCRHPALNTRDDTQSAEPGDQYGARHNPFVYFHSIIDTPDCAANDVPLTELPGDLAEIETTANYSFITPNLCHDGHDEPCVDGQPGGLVSADRFLQEWVPRILGSPAFRRDGLLIVTFDEAEAAPPETPDSSACCNQTQFLNTPNNGGPWPGMGGGRVGAVLLSPFIKPGSVNDTPYNHFSLLRSVEDLFGLDHLGYAESPDPGAFGRDVYNNTKTRKRR
jgi:hypothetical protein